MKMQSGASIDSGRISRGFKITVVLLLFFLTSVRIVLLLFFPTKDIISDTIFLFIVFFIVFYLWVQEVLDFHHLMIINKDLKEAHEELKQSQIDAISSLVKTEEAKDLYTCGHSERVTKIALAIADEMKRRGQDKEIIARAGILHDIGKIGISNEILQKKDKLTDAEWEIIKSHAQMSVNILEPLKFLSAERKVILNHHERYDGKGYPQGLKGEEICPEAMILAVADAFDAMNSSRPYRKALSREEIISELRKARGTQHCAEVIDVFLGLLEKNPKLWEK